MLFCAFLCFFVLFCVFLCIFVYFLFSLWEGPFWDLFFWDKNKRKVGIFFLFCFFLFIFCFFGFLFHFVSLFGFCRRCVLGLVLLCFLFSKIVFIP